MREGPLNWRRTRRAWPGWRNAIHSSIGARRIPSKRASWIWSALSDAGSCTNSSIGMTGSGIDAVGSVTGPVA
jgi:hypothetical protein